MTLLLTGREDQIQVTEEVVKAAARNWSRRKEIMTPLLDRQGDHIQIRENLVEIIIDRFKSEVVLLDQRGDQV